MKNTNNSLEEALRRMANQQEQQDDKITHKVQHKGKVVPIMERKRELEFIPDPEDENGFMPITKNDTTFYLGDDGLPIGKSSQAGFCKFNCYVSGRALSICRHCGQPICRKHKIKVNKSIYCSKGFCAFIGRSYQIFFVIYRVISFCVCSVLGISRTKDEDAHRADDELFDTSSEDKIHEN